MSPRTEATTAAPAAGAPPSAAREGPRPAWADEAAAEPGPSPTPTPPTRAERWLVRRGLATQGRFPIAAVLWDGTTAQAVPGEPAVRVHLPGRRALARLFLDPAMAVPDAYVDGRVEVDGDLAEVIERAFRADREPPLVARALAAAGRLRRRGTPARARENIHTHYDLGNDFYRLWLDEALAYTCAYFPRPDASLEEAQRAKYDHVARKLVLRPGDRVVEAGCGWGTLALHLAERYGVRVRAFNISREQVAYARAEARRRDLADRVEFVLDDYRTIEGRCDAFVSVGMLEHVGKSHYDALGRVIERVLAPEGRGLIHSIGRARPQPMDPWTERRIFPGAYIPSLREMLTVLEPRDLAVLDVENLRLHYARTLRCWRDRFEARRAEVAARFDERFVRLWRLYLASSEAAFRAGTCHLYQVVFAPAGANAVPWTRRHLYAEEEPPWIARTS